MNQLYPGSIPLTVTLVTLHIHPLVGYADIDDDKYTTIKKTKFLIIILLIIFSDCAVLK